MPRKTKTGAEPKLNPLRKLNLETVSVVSDNSFINSFDVTSQQSNYQELHLIQDLTLQLISSASNAAASAAASISAASAASFSNRFLSSSAFLSAITFSRAAAAALAAAASIAAPVAASASAAAFSAANLACLAASIGSAS